MRKLFLGGLHRDTTDDDIKNHFCKFGKVVDDSGDNGFEQSVYNREQRYNENDPDSFMTGIAAGYSSFLVTRTLRRSTADDLSC